MITMSKKLEGIEIDGNAVCNGGIMMISRRKHLKKKNNEPVYDIIKRAEEIGNKDYAIADSSIVKMFENMMSVSSKEEAFYNREIMGKTIKTLNEKIDDMNSDKVKYTIFVDDEKSPYNMREYAKTKLDEIHKNEIIHISMRDALVRMYDAYDIIINMH